MIVVLLAASLWGGDKWMVLHAVIAHGAHAAASEQGAAAFAWQAAVHADHRLATTQTSHHHHTPAGQHSDHHCAVCHAHCCAAVAILTAYDFASLAAVTQSEPAGRDQPHPGQRISPPLRPPRLSV